MAEFWLYLTAAGGVQLPALSALAGSAALSRGTLR